MIILSKKNRTKALTTSRAAGFWKGCSGTAAGSLHTEADEGKFLEDNKAAFSCLIDLKRLSTYYRSKRIQLL